MLLTLHLIMTLVNGSKNVIGITISYTAFSEFIILEHNKVYLKVFTTFPNTSKWKSFSKNGIFILGSCLWIEVLERGILIYANLIG